MIDGIENLKSKLDDDSSLYAKADTRTTKQKWKDLDAAGKWQFFRDYVLLKLLACVAGLALVIYFLVSVLTPKPEQVLTVAILNNPFPETTLDRMTEELTKTMVEDTDKQQVLLDSSYLLSSEEYSIRMKIMTAIAAAELDCMIIPMSELQNDVNGSVAEILTEVLPPELIERAGDRIIEAVYVPDELSGEVSTGIPDKYALNITDFLAKEYGVKPNAKYVMIYVANTKHPENAKAFFEYMLDQMD